jgi:hypothetical protein
MKKKIVPDPNDAMEVTGNGASVANIQKENAELLECHNMIMDEIHERAKGFPVPCMANKNRVMEALDGAKLKYPELTAFLSEVQKFINSRVS